MELVALMNDFLLFVDKGHPSIASLQHLTKLILEFCCPTSDKLQGSSDHTEIALSVSLKLPSESHDWNGAKTLRTCLD